MEPNPRRRAEILAQLSKTIPAHPVQDVGQLNSALAAAPLVGNLISPVRAVDYVPQMHAVSFRYVFLNWEERTSGTSGKYTNVVGDCYRARFCDDSELALSQQGILALWRAAGGRDVSVQRLDDRSDPNFAEVQVAVALQGIDGREITKIKSRTVDLRPASPEAVSMTDKQLPQARQMVAQNAETKAGLRAIRAALDLHQKYTIDQLERPFIIPVLVPLVDTSDPAIRRLVAAKALGVVGELYGAAARAALPPATQEVEGGHVNGDGVFHPTVEAEVVEPDDDDYDLPPVVAAPPAHACECPCGHGASMKPEAHAKTTTLLGTARCAECFPGKSFAYSAHDAVADLAIPKRPDLRTAADVRSALKVA